jgi:hypothetical protein
VQDLADGRALRLAHILFPQGETPATTPCVLRDARRAGSSG